MGSSRCAALGRQVMVSALLGLAAGMAGCAAQPPLRVNAADVKAPLTLAKGQDLYVSLQGNRTTGYDWTWVEKPDALVTLMAEPTYEPAPNAGMVGVGGIETFWFRAKAKGEQTLRFLYRRPWKNYERPIDVKTVAIVVR